MEHNKKLDEAARKPFKSMKELDNAIKKASKNLSKIKDVDTWVNDIKEGKL